MSRDYKVCLEDILTAIEKIRRYTLGMSPEELARDEKTLDAVIRNLEVVGEAVKLIPAEVREEHEQINWNKIAGPCGTF